MVWPSRHLGDVHGVFRISEIKRGVEFGLSHALTTSGRCSISACGITMKPPSSSLTEAPLATLRARPSWTRRDAVGSQITAASSFLARKPLVMTSMLWFRYSDGLMFWP